jgi:hypothetical protein
MPCSWRCRDGLLGSGAESTVIIIRPTVRIRAIVPERRALHEPVPRVQGAGRREVRPRPGLQAQARHPTRPGGRHDVPQHCRSHAPPARRLGRVHGLHLAMIGAQPLERADADDRVALPRRPEGHIGGPEPGEIECMRAAPRRLRPRTSQMGVQQGDDTRVVQAAFDDVHGDLDCSPDRSGDADEQPKPSARHL